MKTDIENKLKNKINEKIDRLNEKINNLNNYVYSEDDLYYKVKWYDGYDNVKNSTTKKTLKESIEWMLNESHPMSVSGCSMSAYLCVNIENKKIKIEYYDIAKDVDKLYSDRLKKQQEFNEKRLMKSLIKKYKEN
jgi:hypothetical protein